MFLPMVLCAVSVAPLMVRAQDDGTDGPPKVLVVHREFMKPGKEGMAHEKTEGAFIEGLKANHATIHYLALTSLSGPDRTLFFSGYPSFAAWEEEEKNTAKNPALTAEMDRANEADGDLLSATDKSIWVRRDDLSLNNTNLLGARYMQISEYIIRPGHAREWEEEIKLIMEGYKKGVPAAHWTMFAMRYGGPKGNAYLIVTPVKSGSEVDMMAGSAKALRDALGEDGLKKRDALSSSAVESVQMNLFAISPRMSSPMDSWVKAEPEFWTPKQ
jgi:hypothetical protein